MERVFQDLETSEITKDAPVVFFPVRHHSPVCSFQLRRLARLYEPDIILIEGPEDANDLIPVLCDEKTELPAAIYCYYRDKKKYVSEAAENYRCYYPFLYSSPEYNAMMIAKEAGIPARFIDLPYAQILIHTAENKGLRQKGKQSYSDDRRLVQGNFYRLLCRNTNVRDFEEFWEKYFEITGIFRTPEEFVRQMGMYSGMTRANSSREELTEDATDMRERYMAANIRAYMENYRRVLVVTGGFHTSGLKTLLAREIKPVKLKAIPDDCTGCFPAAYSYEAADAMHGYASGMEHPYFYDTAFTELLKADSPDGVYDSICLDLLAKCAKETAKRDIPVSIADVTSARTLMTGLAALRNIRECGYHEVHDAVTSTFIKGEKTISSSMPLDILSKLATGDKLGHIGSADHIPPLIADFEDKCRELGLKINTVAPKEAECGLFTSRKGLPLSRFFHMTEYLGTGFARRTAGPDLHRGRDKSRVREIWKYRRSPSVDAALTDHTADGFTIREACSSIAEKKLAGELSCSDAAQTAVDCFLMGIMPDDMEQKILRCIISDGDIFSVGKGLICFDMLHSLEELYKYEGNSLNFLDKCFTRLITALPAMANIPKEQAPEMISIIKTMYSLTETLPVHRNEFIDMLDLLVADSKIEPSVYGAAMGILSVIRPEMRENAQRVLSGYLSGSVAVKKQGAEYLKGLFSTARDIMFGENDFLRLTDRLITEMDTDDFMEILPTMRLAFGYFTPDEIQRTAKAAAELYGEQDIMTGEVIDEALFSFGRRMDSAIADEVFPEGIL